MSAPERDDALAHAVEKARAATEAMMAGESGPLAAMFSPGENIILMGAFGGVFRGRSAVSKRLADTGRVYGGGQRVSVEPLATWIATDLACTVELVRHDGVRLAGHAPTTTAYRVTHVFQREDGEWKIVLHHADPLVEFQGPAAVLKHDE